MYAGEYKKFVITVIDPVTKQPVPLTGTKLTFTMRKRLEDADIEVTKTSDVAGGITFRDQTGFPGIADLVLMHADTVDRGPDLTLPTLAARLADELHIADVWIDDALGNPQVIVEREPFPVKASVRRPAP